MAKLEGVRTIDMVNGEITKISYNGADYVKVAHDFKDAQTGDLFLRGTSGNYYEITIRPKSFAGIPHPVRFIDDEGRDDGYMRECNAHPLFRKVEVQSPTIESLSEKVDGLAERVTALEGGKQALSPAKEITHNGKEYTLVNRKAQAGDVVVFTENRSCCLENGKYYVVVDRGGDLQVDASSDDFYSLYYDKYNRTEANTLVYAPKVEPLKVGDYAVVTADNSTYHGNIVKIKKAWSISADKFDVIDVATERLFGIHNDHLRKATVEEVAKAGKDAVFTRLGRKPGEFKKGDIVRVTSDYPEGSDRKKGYIGEITEYYNNRNFHVGNGLCGWMGKSSVELIAPVESRVDAS